MTGYSNAELAFIVSGVGGVILADPEPLLSSVGALVLFLYAGVALIHEIKND